MYDWQKMIAVLGAKPSAIEFIVSMDDWERLTNVQEIKGKLDIEIDL